MMAIGLKILGAFLTVGSGVVCGAIAARRERTRLTVLEAWIELIERIRLEIDLYLRPLDEILSRVSPSLLLRVGAGTQRKTLQGMLLAAKPYLSNQSQRLIGTLLTELGTSYRHEQVKRCDEQLCALRREYENMRGELPARLRLCKTVCTCIAAGIAILLW